MKSESSTRNPIIVYTVFWFFVLFNAQAQVSIASFGIGNAYTENFTGFDGQDDPLNWVTSNTSSDESFWNGTSVGNTSEGGKYSFGTGSGATFEGSLGFLPTRGSSIIASITFTNDTGQNLDGFDLAYVGEHWRSNEDDRINGWMVSYIIQNSLVDIPQLNYRAPNTLPDGSGLQGSQNLNARVNVTIPAGQNIEISFYGDNGMGNGYRQAVSIDDFSFRPFISSTPPVASNVTFTGNLAVGQILTASYQYTDIENDPENGTTFQWYHSDDANGTNKEAIAGANALTYTVSEIDINKYISVEVTPRNSDNAGTPVESNRQLIDVELPAFRYYFDQALSFNDDGYVNINGQSGISASEINEAFSIAMWVKTTAANAALFGEYAGGSAHTKNFLSLFNGKLVFDQFLDSGGSIIFDTHINTGEWVHVVYVQAGGVARAYINGVLEATTGTAEAYKGVNPNQFFLGLRGGSVNTGYFNGAMDEVAWWTKALSAQEVSEVFQGRINREPSLKGYLPFNKSATTDIINASANLNATMANGMDANDRIEGRFNTPLVVSNNLTSGRVISESLILPTVNTPTYTLIDADGAPIIINNEGKLQLTANVNTNFTSKVVYQVELDGSIFTSSFLLTLNGNTPPVATNARVVGTLKTFRTVAAVYDYSDIDNNPESGSTLQWFRADDAQGTNQTAIAGATAATYTLTAADADKYFAYQVTPNDGINTGATIESNWVGPVQNTLTKIEQRNGGSVRNLGLNSVIGQSFTATQAGLLNEIAVQALFSSRPAMLRVYQGEGTTGNLLYQQEVSLSVGFNSISLNPPVMLSANTVYTFTFTRLTSGDQSIWLSPNNPYPGGTAYDNAGALIGSDLLFSVTINVNLPPSVSDVTYIGNLKVGSELTGSYTYVDVDNDLESGSEFQWYRADDAQGTNEVAIMGANALKYTPTASDEFKFLSFGVKPKDGFSFGTEVKSNYQGPVLDPPAFASATKNSPTQITLSYNQAVQTNGGNPTDFTVTDCRGNTFAVSGQADGTVGDAEIILTVASLEFAVGDINITYTNNNGEISNLRGTSQENDATGVVIAASADAVAPTFSSAVKNSNTEISLTFSESVDILGTNPTDFTVTDGAGNTYAISAIANGTIGDAEVTLTVADISGALGDLTVTYTNNNNEVVDFACNAMATDATGVIINLDSTAPNLVSATKDSDTQITLTFSEKVQIDGADAGNFTVQDGNSNSFNVLSLNDGTAQDNQLILGFTDLSPASAKITITYNPTSGNISDFGGNNLAADATGVEILLDVTAPSGYSVSLDDDLINATEAANATFTFANAEVGATYNYTVSSNGGGTDVTGSGTIATATDQITLADLSGLEDGELTLSVILTDAANNVGVAVTDNANLDTTTPNAPTIGAVGNDNGPSDSDFITNDQSLIIGGIAEANSSVEVFIDNASIGSTTTNAQGTYLLDYTGSELAEGSYSITAKATDAAGNTSGTSTTQGLEIDLTVPTISITSNANDPQSGAFTATFTFSEDVSGFTEGDISVGNGVVSNFNTTSAKIYTATITPSADGEVTIDVLANKAEDVAGNANTAAAQLSLTNDETAPAAPIVASISSDTGISHSDNLTNDQTLEISGAAEANASIEVFIDGNSVGNTTADGSGDWTFDYTATTLTEATYSITAKSTDAAGNTSAASAALSATIDTTTPNRTAGSIVGKTYGLDQNMDIVVDYNEIVLVETTGGTPAINISMGGQTRTAAYLSGSGTTSLTFRYTTVSGDFDGNGVSLSSIQLNGGSITDAAGNNAELNGAYTGEGAVRVDTAIPSLSITSSSNRTSGAFSATFTFSEDVSGFSLNDISVTNGTASNFNTISASVYTATITPSNDGEVTVDVSADAAIDAGGNGNAVAIQLSVTNDETAPSVTITTNANDPHSGDFTATFSFSEDVSGFDVNDISVTNGSASNFNTTSARVYSARITPTADGQVTVGVAANKAADLAGNFNIAATSINLTNDQTAPSLVSVTKDSDTQMTLTFSEPVVPGANAHTGITVYGGNNKFENAVSASDGTVGDNQIVLTFNSLSALLGDLEVLHSGGSTIADLAGNVYPLDGTGAKVDDTTAPILVSATKDSDTQITLTFSEEVQTLGNNPTDFTVVDDNSINFLVQAITDGTAEDNKLILTVADMSNAQLNLNITYTNNNNEVSDFGGNQLATDATGVNISLNAPPTATAVSFSGTLTVGETLTGAYTYADADNDTETGTTFKWYRSDDINGTNKAAIPGATASTYGLTSTDVDKYISFEVNPNDGKNTGASVESVIQGPISKISQTITFNALNDKTYGDASFDLTATASSNLGLTYTSSNSNVATVSGNTVTIVGAGTTTLTASQSGDASYSAATDATQLLTVNKAVLTATAEDKSKTYGEANPAFTISYTGFVNGDDKSVLTTVPTASTVANATSGVGTYDITLSGGVADNYSLITNNGFLTIGKATLTATADDKTKTYGEANPAFTISYTGFVNGDDKSVLTTVPTASTVANASTGVGTYDITLSGGVADNYSLITNNGFLTISKATLIATADDKSKTYGETNPAFTISYTGFVNGDDRTAITTEPTASTTANASTGVGTYDITLSGGVADNYSLITNNGSLTIGKATLTATADDKSKIYGEANPSFTISYTGFVNGDDKTAITTEPTASTTANASTGAGTYDITLSGGTADNYSLVTNKGSLTIGKATLTATADDKSKIYGEVNPAFTISYTGFVNGDDKTAITTEPTASTMADATSGVGTYDITLSGGAADNYSLLTNNGSLTIGKATLTAKADDKQRAVGQDNPAFTISYSGFVNGDNVSDIDVQPTASTTANVATAAGTASITLTGGSDNNYDFNLVDGTLTIVEVSFITSVSVPNDGTYAIGDELSFAINFALPVTITGSPTLPLTIGSNTVAASLYGTVADATKATFNYKVEDGDLDTDGIVLGTSIDLNGGTILDGFGENAILTLNNIASTAGVKVDGVRAIPTLSSSVGNLTNSTFSVTVTYDEPVSGLTAEDLEITNGTADNVTVVTTGLVWSADITPITDGATTVSVKSGAVADNAGNTSLVSNNSITTTFDGTAPIVTSIIRAEADQIPTGTTNRNFTVTFSEEVIGVDVTDFEVITTASATASINSVTTVDAKTYTVNVNGISGEGTIGLNAKDDNSITDMATNSLAAAFTGEVYTTNFVPTDITLSASSIQENNGVGDEIASLTTVDADAGDSFTYSLVLGTGSADNASFTISGDKLLAAEVYDFELKNSYSIRIKTDDGFGGTFEKALTIEITNEGEAVIDIAGDGDFDQTALGLSSTKTWTITNDGDAATEVRVISSTEGFSFNPGSVQVGAGESKEITAVFSPTEAKVYNGTVVFNFDITDEMQDNVIEVNLTGEGMIVTGLDNGQINEEQIGVFPNPASNYVTIDLSELNGMPLNIQMISPTGVSTLEKEGYDKSELRIDVANFESGLYIIQFSNKSSLVRKKVLVRK